MKYLVLEVHPGYAVLLDTEGRFVRAANLGYTVGETVTDIVIMRENAGSRFGRTVKLVSGIAAAAAYVWWARVCIWDIMFPNMRNMGPARWKSIQESG